MGLKAVLRIAYSNQNCSEQTLIEHTGGCVHSGTSIIFHWMKKMFFSPLSSSHPYPFMLGPHILVCAMVVAS